MPNSGAQLRLLFRRTWPWQILILVALSAGETLAHFLLSYRLLSYRIRCARLTYVDQRGVVRRFQPQLAFRWRLTDSGNTDSRLTYAAGFLTDPADGQLESGSE